MAMKGGKRHSGGRAEPYRSCSSHGSHGLTHGLVRHLTTVASSAPDGLALLALAHQPKFTPDTPDKSTLANLIPELLPELLPMEQDIASAQSLYGMEGGPPAHPTSLLLHLDKQPQEFHLGMQPLESRIDTQPQVLTPTVRYVLGLSEEELFKSVLEIVQSVHGDKALEATPYGGDEEDSYKAVEEGLYEAGPWESGEESIDEVGKEGANESGEEGSYEAAKESTDHASEQGTDEAGEMDADEASVEGTDLRLAVAICETDSDSGRHTPPGCIHIRPTCNVTFRPAGAGTADMYILPDDVQECLKVSHKLLLQTSAVTGSNVVVYTFENLENGRVFQIHIWVHGQDDAGQPVCCRCRGPPGECETPRCRRPVIQAVSYPIPDRKSSAWGAELPVVRLKFAEASAAPQANLHVHARLVLNNKGSGDMAPWQKDVLPAVVTLLAKTPTRRQKQSP